MSNFARAGYNQIIVAREQALTHVEHALHSLIPQYDQIALVAIALQFPQETSPLAGQESATTICKQLRERVRGSDQIYLLQREAGLYGLFFLLPEADLKGGRVVHQRLQDVLSSSVLPQIDGPTPQQIEIRNYALSGGGNQASLLIEGPTYTAMVAQGPTMTVRSLPTSPGVQCGRQDSLLLPSALLPGRADGNEQERSAFNTELKTLDTQSFSAEDCSTAKG